ASLSWKAGTRYGPGTCRSRSSDRCTAVQTAGHIIRIRACQRRYGLPLCSRKHRTTMSRTAHELDHRIVGDDMQCVEITLDPMETVIAEAGTMMMMDEGIEMKTIFGSGDGKEQGFMDKLWG